MTMRILAACDSFKGSISSTRAGALVEAVVQRMGFDASVQVVPVADGGEGTVQALADACGGEVRVLGVAGPLGEEVKASWALLPGGRAVIEMAEASGLTLIDPARRDPRNTSTFGTGELLRSALNAGAQEISLALGGSATNDGGMGAMRALGVRFLDERGDELSGTGADLGRVRSIDLDGLDPRVRDVRFRAMCDVDNPLLGASGSAEVFAPQKGADPATVHALEQGMAAYAHVLADLMGIDVSRIPGAGAAGGLGAAALAFLSAEMTPGVECVLDLVGFDEMLGDIDLVITGEGHADAQSLRGKLMGGVASRARAAGVPTVAIVGGMSPEALSLHEVGVDVLVPCVIDACGIDEAMRNAEENFSLAVERALGLIELGQRLAD